MDELDKKIFIRGSDNPLNAKDEIWDVLEKWIDDRVNHLSNLKYADRSEIMNIPVGVAMLYRLSSYFSNDITKKTRAMLWRHQVLSFFDLETQSRGDGNHAGIKKWRAEIEANFDRLIAVLTV